jgi:diamine N-acetyltransferase
MASVRLEPISPANVKAVFDLKVAPGQERFVADNAWSLAEAVAEQATAWPRAIHREGDQGDEVVGFLMLSIDPDDPDGQPFYLWRFMIGAEHQRQGLGTAAITSLLDEVRSRGGSELYTSWVPGEDGPEGFYLGLDFVPTGEIDDGEVVATRTIDPSPPPATVGSQ